MPEQDRRSAGYGSGRRSFEGGSNDRATFPNETDGRSLFHPVGPFARDGGLVCLPRWIYDKREPFSESGNSPRRRRVLSSLVRIRSLRRSAVVFKAMFRPFPGSPVEECRRGLLPEHPGRSGPPPIQVSRHSLPGAHRPEHSGPGRWLARRSGGRLTFFSALNERGKAWAPYDLDQPASFSQPGEESAARVLRDLVEQDRREGLDAHAVLAAGKGWVELLHQVARGRHDLLVVGSRDDAGLWLRPVWQYQPRPPAPLPVSRLGVPAAPGGRPAADPRRHRSQSHVGDALRLGIALVRMNDSARLHVLHVVDYPLDHVWSTGLSDVWTQAYRRQVRRDVEETIRKQLAQAGDPVGEDRVELHFVDGAGIKDDVIVGFIHEQAVDLVILGTAVRRGLWGVLLGNTAERLLPEVRCSVLAVKPPDFHPPALPE